MRLSPIPFLTFALVGVAGSAAAELPRVHAAAGLGHATGGHQQEEYAWGAAAWGGVEYPFGKELGLELDVSWLGLGQGEPPSDPGVAPETGAFAILPSLGVRLRPFGSWHGGRLGALAGIWAKLAGGVAFTGGLARPLFGAQLGYDIMDAKGRIGLGPMLAYVHVFQPNDEFRPADANVGLLGVHAFYDFGPGLKPDVKGDRDADGILDDVDRCPDTPEDKDGFQDLDGCPDLDNDADGIPDLKDKCPVDPEDRDKFEDEDGCPEKDNDKDGLLDRVDQCPNQPEDPDGWESLDGCPDPDNDRDGILDVNDLCPFEPETMNGYADNDGCPDEEQVRVVGDKIVLDDRVHFFVNSAVIRKVSYPLLQRLTKLVTEHPEYKHISVEGHADERGAEEFNRKLSEDRARSVLEFMVKQGVALERLSSQGFGASRPLVDKKNEYSWLLNRRVEFTVTRQLRQGGTTTSATTVNVPGEHSLPQPAPSPIGPAAVPAAGDAERESATPPPEAGNPDAEPKPGAPGGRAPKKPQEVAK